MTIHLSSQKVSRVLPAVQFMYVYMNIDIVGQYTSQVSEDTAGETLITTIKATDKDSDELNRKITYTISNVTIIGSSTPSDANVCIIPTMHFVVYLYSCSL